MGRNKVVFTHGYFIQEDEKETQIMRPYPPLGILYISAYLEEKGLDNDVFDSTFSSFSALKSYLLADPPAILCIYTNLMTKLNVIRLMHWAREAIPNTTIVLGGPDITYNWENYLRAGANYLIIGEGEETSYALISALLNKESIDHISGIARWDQEGNMVKHAPRVKIKNIDSLPFPAREKIDLNKYLNAWKTHHGTNAINVSTQRGCPFTCKWCSTAVYGQSYRRRSPDLVADEIEYLIKTYQPDSIWFVDDVFTVNYKWIKNLARVFAERGIKIPFECITRAERLNTEILKHLSDMGCFRIWIGAESGSQKIIDAMDRKVSIEQVRSMMAEARKFNIECGTFIMVGYPGEDEKDIADTISHLKLSNPDVFTITLAYPIKGTQLYNEIEGDIITDLDWETSTDREIDFKRLYSTRYYQFAVRRIVNELKFYQKKKEYGIFASKALMYKFKSLMAKGAMLYAKRI